jgi:hypothetical protein
MVERIVAPMPFRKHAGTLMRPFGHRTFALRNLEISPDIAYRSAADEQIALGEGFKCDAAASHC